MQMRAGDAAARSYAPDNLPCRHAVAFVDVERGEVREHRKQAQAVIDHHGISGKVQAARDHDPPGIGCMDCCAGGAHEVGAAVRIARDLVEDAARTEGAVGRLRDGPHEWGVPQPVRNGGSPHRLEQRRLARDALFCRWRRRDECRIDGKPSRSKLPRLHHQIVDGVLALI